MSNEGLCILINEADGWINVFQGWGAAFACTPNLSLGWRSSLQHASSLNAVRINFLKGPCCCFLLGAERKATRRSNKKQTCHKELRWHFLSSCLFFVLLFRSFRGTTTQPMKSGRSSLNRLWLATSASAPWPGSRASACALRSTAAEHQVHTHTLLMLWFMLYNYTASSIALI